MKEGTVTRWLKAVGDPVAAGEPIAEVETEKVIVEVVAPQAGVLLEIQAAEQSVVAVEGVLCRIGKADELREHAAAGCTSPTQPSRASRESGPTALPRFPSASNGVLSGRPAREEGMPNSAAQPALIAKAVGVSHATGTAAQNMGVSPLARRVAAELALDLTQVRGTGVGGKIVVSDLEPFLVTRQLGAVHTGPSRSALPAVIPTTTEAAPNEADAPAAASGMIDVPHSPLRKAIARRMAESKATIPHFYMTAAVDATDLLALRARLNGSLAEAPLSLNDFLLKATALALLEVPALNAEYGELALRRHKAVHLAFAVATEAGLYTPVVRDCHLKSLGVIAREAEALVAKAKARSLAAVDLQGGTFTVSNLGMYDVAEFSAIINPPQVAILAVARPQERPAACNGRVIVRASLNVTVSADHRALDGVTVAKFLQAFRTVVEEPERLLV
jgi:pyruvate dehydrogenase E2 component (dihydrolipoamide acetyltransferase)